MTKATGPPCAAGITRSSSRNSGHALEGWQEDYSTRKLPKIRSGPIGAFTAGHDNPATDAAIIDYVPTCEGSGGREIQSARQRRHRGPFGTAAKKLKEWDLKP